ncbi:MAG: polyprenyl synthetase family protein [Lachnospiraceae bacterium]|nr:polyprenyl synthetase family protein [Lachnospiraceae bacterium]
MNFEEVLKSKTDRAERVLFKYMPEETGFQKKLLEAMNYSVSAGGKRLRPILMEESFLLFGGKGAYIEPFMAALEMIHNYSLIHDDLPAMDNDEYRRGRLTTWKVYGEGMAVLSGDGLLNLAFETAADAFTLAEDENELRRIAGAIRILGKKAGIYGMIGGQCGDLEAEAALDVSGEMLTFIHENKTAALLQAAFMIGAVLAGADEDEVGRMEQAAYDIGIAFQIQDDILDVTSSTEILGKPVGSDEKNNKLTYVSMHGLEKSREEVLRLSEEALEILGSFDRKNPFLEELVRSLAGREK